MYILHSTFLLLLPMNGSKARSQLLISRTWTRPHEGRSLCGSQRSGPGVLILAPLTGSWSVCSLGSVGSVVSQNTVCTGLLDCGRNAEIFHPFIRASSTAFVRRGKGLVCVGDVRDASIFAGLVHSGLLRRVYLALLHAYCARQERQSTKKVIILLNNTLG